MEKKKATVEAGTERAAGLKAIHEAVGFDAKVLDVNVEEKGKVKDSRGRIERVYYFPTVNDHIYAVYNDGECHGAECPTEVGTEVDKEEVPRHVRSRYDDRFLEEKEIREIELHEYAVQIKYVGGKDD